MRIDRTRSLARGGLVSGLAVVALVALGGCATSPPAEDNIDYAKVERVNRAARSMGLQVIWVNYPVKPQRAATQPASQ